MASIGELFVELGIVADVKQGKQVDELLDKLSKKSVKTTEGMEGLNKAFNNFKKAIGLTTIVAAVRQLDSLTKSLVQTNQAMLNLTRTSNISLDTFQKWGSVGKLFGIQNVAQQMAGLNERLFELKLTGQGARGFQLAGINPMGTDAQGVLEQLGNRVSGVDDTTASYLLKQLGLDPSMLHILRLGREDFESLWKTINRYQLNDDQRKEIQKLNIQLQIAATKLQYLKDRAILAIMPAWTKFLEGLTRITEMLMRAGKAVGEFVWKFRSLFAAVAIGLSKFRPAVELFNKLKGILTTASTKITGLITKIPLLGKVFGVLGAAISKWLLPLTTAYLLLDDIAVFSQGGDSLIGRVVEWFKESGEDFGKIFSKMFGGDFLGGLKELFIKVADVFDDFGNVVLRLIQILTGIPIADWADKQRKNNPGYDNFKNYEYGEQSYMIPIDARPYMTPISKNYSTNKNQQLIQNITINTNEPAQCIRNEAIYGMACFAGP